MFVSGRLFAYFITLSLLIVTGCAEKSAPTPSGALNSVTDLTKVSGNELITSHDVLLNPVVDVTITPEDVSVRDLNSIISEYPENTRFLIKAGTYRMQTISPKKGMVFYGDVDTAGKRYTILNGSRLLINFGQADGLYFVTGQNQQGNFDGAVEAGWEGSAHPEDLFFDDAALKQVLSKAEVTTNTWYFDYANDTIWFANNPTGHTVETSVTPYAFYQTNNQSTAPRVTVKGFIVEKYANKANKGAVGGEAHNEQWYVEYNEIRLNHASGLLVGANSQVLYNYSHHNGQIGMKAGGDGCVFQGNEISYNNTQHFLVGVEAGGAKFAAIDGLTIKANYVHHNYGRGLWVDVGAHNITIDSNLITHNYNEGVFYEVSDTGMITNNKLAHNGQESPWLFGGGIVISSSANVDVSGNTVIVNADYGNGITALWTDRHLSYAVLGHTPPLRVENINIHDNDITYLGVLNVQNGQEPRSGAIAANAVDEYDASGTINGVKPNASIVVSNVTITDSRLNNRFNRNSYHVVDVSKLWFIWGPTASRLSWQDYRAFGADIDGTLDANVTDASVSWAWPSLINIDSLSTEVVW